MMKLLGRARLHILIFSSQSKSGHAGLSGRHFKYHRPKLGDPKLGDPKLGDPKLGDPEVGDHEVSNGATPSACSLP